ncbi:unnamed protein product [Moneuplotes crassus]|uniref:Uncharacterized protein n=1 Tax=Euplotes crassus TaxID=5936 RepID=A0AAD2D689_EUPCR|nr:unnamed protein product [Moneuplotes crassus]
MGACCRRKNGKRKLLPCKRFCCCCTLSKGMKFVIILYVLVFLAYMFSLFFQILEFKNDSIDCATIIGHVQSSMCGIFGRESFMVVAYPLIITTLYGAIAIFGIYVWRKQFNVFSVEKYFYMVFVAVGFENINGVISSIAMNNNLVIILGIIGITVLVHAYFVGIVYSFLLETDTKYRIQRRADGKEEKNKTPEVTEIILTRGSQVTINSDSNQE